MHATAGDWTFSGIVHGGVSNWYRIASWTDANFSVSESSKGHGLVRMTTSASSRTASGSYDRRGDARPYPGGSRPLVVGESRRDILIAGYDASSQAILFTLRGPKLEQAETWTVLAWQNGVELARTEVTLDATARYASVDGSLPVAPDAGLNLVAHRNSDEPLRPGIGLMLWRPGELATVSTPVFTDEVRVLLTLSRPQKALPVLIRSADGEVLGQGVTDVDRGQHVLVVPIDPAWPDALEIDVGAMLSGTWAPLLRASAQEVTP